MVKLSKTLLIVLVLRTPSKYKWVSRQKSQTPSADNPSYPNFQTSSSILGLHYNDRLAVAANPSGTSVV